MKTRILVSLVLSCITFGFSVPPTSVIRINQLGYELNGPKFAVIQYPTSTTQPKTFEVQTLDGAKVFSGNVSSVTFDTVPMWPGFNWVLDFSDFKQAGTYKIKVDNKDTSFKVFIGENILFTKSINELLYCYTQMRNTIAGDKSIRLCRSATKVNVYGGYSEASGDKSKHISHLQYSNYLCGAENPALTWSLGRLYEKNSKFFDSLTLKTKFFEEIAWGADYLYRSCSPDGYFYSTVFNMWDETAERVVTAYQGALESSTSFNGAIIKDTTANYQTAFREGGGISIAALARAAALKVTGGEFTFDNYLEAAKKAYDHIKANNLKYCDDGKENIADDYEALVAAIELFKTTADAKYKTDAGDRAEKLMTRQTADGWFASDDAKSRPYYHANEEGMPIIALAEYMEIDNSKDAKIRDVIGKNVSWYFKISREAKNPFNYVRLYAKPFKSGALQPATSSFFIPKYNETAYWWQGENARLGSMATAMLVAAKVLNPGFTLGKDSLSQLALAQIDWVLGKNPFELCMLHKSGTVNPIDYTQPDPNTPSTSIRGGICNGITSYGKMLTKPFEGIMFTLPEATGDNLWWNWRWLEQWLPHEFWYMNAIGTLCQIIREGATGVTTGQPIGSFNAMSMRISHNKLSQTATITFQGPIKPGSSIALFDARGRLVHSTLLNGVCKQITLATRNYAAGVYFVELTNGKIGIARSKLFMMK